MTTRSWRAAGMWSRFCTAQNWRQDMWDEQGFRVRCHQPLDTRLKGSHPFPDPG